MSDAEHNNAPRILVVDDEPRNRSLLEAMLKPEGYDVITANDGEQALDVASRHHIDLILLDIMMPGMNGYQVVGKLKSGDRTRNVPVIIITSLNDRNAKLMALNAGAEEFVNKPVDRAELWVRVRNLLRLKEYNDIVADHRKILSEEVRASMMEIGDGILQTVTRLTQVLRRSTPESLAHAQRMGLYAQCLANNLGKDNDFSQRIYLASQLHDIGMVAIPDSILKKPGELSTQEFAMIKEHCGIGARIMESEDNPFMKMASQIAMTHHERMDGSGYPYGLAGETIPLPGKIVALCDVYDALRTRTQFRTPVSHEQAVIAILEGDQRSKPHHFDPEVRKAFRDAAKDFERIYYQHRS